MHTRPTARRLIAGALITGAAAVALPAVAEARSSCVYNESNKHLVVNDANGAETLRIVRTGDQIRIADSSEPAARFCAAPGPLGVATVHNTERIAIFRSVESMPGGVTLVGSFTPGVTPEADGFSEVEITINSAGFSAPNSLTNTLRVTGSPQNDVIAANPDGRVDFGNDADGDITGNVRPDTVMVDGAEGDDILRGVGVFEASSNALFLNGGAGNDTIAGGPERDDLRGGAGDDRLYSVDAFNELIHGDDAGLDSQGLDGLDDVAIINAGESPIHVERKFVSSGGIGQLRLSPGDRQVKAGKVARLRLSWKHPKAWKALRAIDLKVYKGSTSVGKVTLRPRSGRVVAHGIKLATDPRIGHKGTTVSAKLALRIAKALAGQTLRVEIIATDADGRRQVEPTAGLIHVLK